MERRRLIPLTIALGLGAMTLVNPALAVHPEPAERPPIDGARVVHVGGGDLRNSVVTDLEVQFMAFYPETAKVKRGGTVEWRFPPGFATLHTVTFLPADMDVAEAPEPLEGAHDHIVRADEAPGTLALSESLMLGSGCGLIFADGANGRQAQEPCAIGSTGVRYSSQLSDAFFNIASGHPQGFAAVIDLPPGRYRYHCNWHPSMHGYVEVVEDDVELPSDEQVEGEVLTAMAQDLATARALSSALSTQTPALDGDQRVWTVHAGATSADRRVTINDYIPAELEVEPGDAVRFVSSGAEPQTVTFPAGAVGSFTLQGCDMSTCKGDFAPVGLVGPAFPWLCEYDDPSGGAPGVPTWVTTKGCPGGGTIEWQLGPHVADPTPAPGNLVVTDSTLHNSGWIVGAAGLPGWYTERPGPGSFPETFDAVFPSEGTFTYACLIHPGKVATEAVTGPARQGMVGTIRVRRP